jgi:hypothetical protein
VEAGDLGIGGGHGVDVLPVRGWFLGLDCPDVNIAPLEEVKP